MAKQTGARKCGKQTVVHMVPSVNLTKVGSAIVPIPYPVSYDLANSREVSEDVNFNSDEAFIMGSDSNKVQGDSKGEEKGIKSGTVSGQADPIEHSSSVRINCKQAVRCGDMFYMNDKNTIGSLTCSVPVSAPKITDSGKIECDGGGE